jgi:hypothetical protein
VKSQITYKYNDCLSWLHLQSLIAERRGDRRDELNKKGADIYTGYVGTWTFLQGVGTGEEVFTFDTELLPPFATQMLAPSKAKL